MAVPDMTLEEYNICVDRYADAVYRFVLFQLRVEQEAQDVVQDAFEKMWKLRANIDGSKAKSYLFTTAYHRLIDVIRRRKVTLDIEHMESAIIRQPEEFTDVKRILNAAIRKLPAVQQSVILLRDYEGYTYQEIGDITGLSESQVKVYIYRGRITLKEFLVSPEKLI